MTLENMPPAEWGELAKKAHANAVAKGFHSVKQSNGHFIMLIITEISEFVQADRDGKWCRSSLAMYKDLIDPNTPARAANGSWIDNFEAWIGKCAEVELADIAIRLADLAGLLGLDFGKMKPCNYHRAFYRFTVTENALALIGGLCNTQISVERRVFCGLDYVFNWADSLGVDLWFFIQEKMRYNETRPERHGKKY